MITKCQNRTDFFEPGDRSSLVCIDEPDLQSQVFGYLDESGYRVHTGLSSEDAMLKLRTHTYDLVIIYEHFGGGDAETNFLLQELESPQMSKRRNQVMIVIGANMATSDELQAFCLNVDHVISIMDAESLSVIIRQAVNRCSQSYLKFNECLLASGVA